MNTLLLVRRAAALESSGRDEALAALTADDSHYPALLQSLAQDKDTSVNFWILSILTKYFPTLLQRDAGRAIPQLLSCLAWGDGPICDRAAWAMSIIGEPALEALLARVEATPDTAATARYIEALRSNHGLYAAAERVIDSLTAKLSSPDEEVQFRALAVLMDISPLRPQFDSRLNSSSFEQIYGRLLTAAYKLAPQQRFGFASTYIELLEKHLAK